ncbi:DNA glycosylase [Teratosphaeria nubilosa]|uniref:DNA glycosylase n=1 Tax=Teratosphaeria nubilosa TaxID=161662 RepID=A0A6G1L8G6_9PEZI|nr:DNA glycosylase [Teratosphaeria nubilosa]
MARMTRAAAAKANGSTMAPRDLQQLSSPPATPLPNQTKKAFRSSAKSSAHADKKSLQPATPASNRKRKAIKQEQGDIDDLPHNLGKGPPTPVPDEHNETHKPKPPKRAKRVKTEESSKDSEVKANFDEGMFEPKEIPKKTPKKPNYGLTPGQSPYPDYERPTSEECYEVKRLLEKVHGKVEAPKAIPPPSLDVAGCGEVPSVLDALVRTRLSANTTNKNSSTAFQGLVARFGTIKEGIGKGSVDWDAVRQAPQREVFKAIERGGLAQIKSKDIQAILQMVYEENQERKNALIDSKDAPVGAEREPEAEKQDEVVKAKHNIISLDHLHLLSTNDAINKLLSYPGIGPKTASCVALFCLQRPSFAVDTHVFRLCRYLGWVPKSAKKGQPKVDRNTTYSHCDARIPDELKYALHYLFVKHGKVCPRCRAATGTSSANWEEGCPIEHLVRRHGQKKGGVSVAARKKAKEAAGELEDGGESNDDLSDVSD